MTETNQESLIKSDEGVFMGYSTTIRAYWVFNSRIKKIMETIKVIIDDFFDQLVNLETQSPSGEPSNYDTESSTITS